MPLIRIDPDGTVGRSSQAFTFPNGMERDVHGRLVIAETFADRVTTIAPDGRTVATVELETGAGPDGLSIGPDGTIFVALAFAGSVVALRPGGAPTGDASAPRVVHRSTSIGEGPAAGPVGVYDCAVTPDGRWLAVASASADEDLAMRHDTGRIDLIDIAGRRP